MWTEAGVDIPNEVVDRAHRIGPSYTDQNQNVECNSVIVRFTTFQHRAMVYRAKKKMKPGVRVKLDLTKSMYTLFIDVNKVVKQNRQSWTNIWHKVKKSSKVGQDFKILLSNFACFLTAIVKV